MRDRVALAYLVRTVVVLWVDVLRLIRSSLRSRTALAAEKLFLRKQLGLYRERSINPRRASNAAGFALALLAQCFAWRDALVIVKPETLVRWHREGFRLFWRWRSKPRGRPRVPADLRRLIATMAADNPTWGEKRIAAELLLKLGIRVSPRTVRRYMPDGTGGAKGPSSQRWGTFVRNHAQAMLACDFCVAVTATFRVLYVFVVLEVGSRRLVHCNVTGNPTAAWTLQQFREVLAEKALYRFVLHDRDAIYSHQLDTALTAMGVRVLRTPVRAPQANAFCERLLGTLRRECLDFLIPLTEAHFRRILKEWVVHYTRGRPHARLGPGISNPPASLPAPLIIGHYLPPHHRVTAQPGLGGLHHEYGLLRIAA